MSVIKRKDSTEFGVEAAHRVIDSDRTVVEVTNTDRPASCGGRSISQSGTARQRHGRGTALQLQLQR